MSERFGLYEPGPLRRLARNWALSLHSLFMRPSKEPVLRLLFCHYVFEDQRKRFETIIRYLQSIGEFVNTDRVLEVVHGGAPLERNAFHLSFDDGMKSIVDNALPVLRDHNVPAALFVPTAVVSARKGEFTEVRRILAACDPNVEMASWDDLGKAHADGFDIGSHTRTHARLTGSLSTQGALEDEIAGSKDDIERQLGITCRYISWPYGRLQDVEDSALDVVRKAGYEACFGAFRGHIRPGVTNPYRIPRHHIVTEWPLSHVKCFALGAWEVA